MSDAGLRREKRIQNRRPMTGRRSLWLVSLVGLCWCFGRCPSVSCGTTTTTSSHRGHRKLVRVHPDEAIPGCYVVEIRDVAHGGGLEAILRDHPGVPTPTRVYRRALRGFASCFSDATLNGLLEDARVTRIGQDGILTEERETAPTTKTTTTSPRLVSRRTRIQSPAPFHLDRIDGNVDETYEYALDGTGVTVYVMDSGTRATHEEFEDRLDADCFAPSSSSSSDPSTANVTSLCRRDDTSHGTHIAALVGGVTYGVAKNVRLHTVRVRDAQNELAWSHVYAGWDYIVSDVDAKKNGNGSSRSRSIVNLSITGTANAQADAAAQVVMDAGIRLVVAAGNQDDDACWRSPSRLADAVAVGATDVTSTTGDVRRALSNTGPCVTLWAPGSDVRSADSVHDAAWTFKSGTSMAAPLVAGALALYLQAGGDVADMLARAEWIDALADGDTTGRFLSLRDLNDEYAATTPTTTSPAPVTTSVSSEEEEKDETAAPSEMPSAQSTVSATTAAPISGPVLGSATAAGDANATDAGDDTSGAAAFALRQSSVILLGLCVAMATTAIL